MRALIACIAFTMPLNVLHAQSNTDAAPTTLAALRDQARPLLIFASPGDARVEQQYADLAQHAQDMRERDMRVACITASRNQVRNDGRLPEAIFAPDEQKRLRERFHVGQDEFTVLLIGKDGGEKLRSSTPLPWSKLASTIDAMPMRRDEMRAR